MMPQPATRSNRQICDGLRSCATPHGRCPADFAGVVQLLERAKDPRQDRLGPARCHGDLLRRWSRIRPQHLENL